MDASLQLVVRNSFLELIDDMPALGPVEPQRPRAMTDITDTRQAKVEPCFPGELLPPLASLREEPPRVSTPSQPYAGMPHTVSSAMPMYAAAPWWGYQQPQAAADGFNQMANYFCGYQQQYSAGGAASVTEANPQGKDQKAKAKLANGKQDVWSMREEAERHFGRGPAAAASVAQVPNKAEKPSAPVEVGGDATTVMLRNIPNRYTQTMLLELLDAQNFRGQYDFVYLPMDFRNAVNLGYAFVNLFSQRSALKLMDVFQGFSAWMFDSSKVCEVSWAHPHQGLSEHVERYRNSPVMHASMPDEYKPMVFNNGVKMPFPAPTKTIRAPKLRPVRDRAYQIGSEAGGC